MQKLLLGITLTLLALCLAATAPAQEESAPAIRTDPPPTTSGGSGMALLNLDNTVALHGYDSVAYFTRNRPVKGNKKIY